MPFGRIFVWSNPAGGHFNLFDNWTPQYTDKQPPGPDDLVIFNSKGTITIDGDNSLVAEIDVVLDTTLIVQHHAMEGTGSGSGVGLVVNSGGMVIVDNGAEVPDAGAVDVVGFTETGTIDVAAGGHLDDSGMVLGDRATGFGKLMVEGPGAIVEIGAALPGSPNGQLLIGNAGTGEVDILNGGSLGSINAIVGQQSKSIGTVTLDAAKWDAGLLTIGQGGKGNVTVQNGGILTNASMVIGSGGELTVSAAGTVSSFSMTMAGGTLDVAPGGIVTIGPGTGPTGAVSVNTSAPFFALGTINGDVVLSSQGTLQATGTAPGILAINGDVTGNIATGSGTLEPLMTLRLQGAVAAGVAIVFNAPNLLQAGVLVLDDATEEGGTISGFSEGNTIEITGPHFTNALFTPGTLTNPGTLTLTGASETPLTLPVAGNYASGDFKATPDGTGTTVTLAPCFAAGTRIATSEGAVRVEQLKIGTRVKAQFAGMTSVKWIGHRTVDCRRHPDPSKVWPVRITAGAFGPRAPCRDLLLSPDHAVFVGDVLIPIRCLVNGSTIVQQQRDTITYFHIELDRHDVLLAEDLPTESFLSAGNRSAFDNGDGAVQLHPDFQSRVWEAQGCAPLIVTGPLLEAVRAKLSAVGNQMLRTDRETSSPSRRRGSRKRAEPPRLLHQDSNSLNLDYIEYAPSIRRGRPRT